MKRLIYCLLTAMATFSPLTSATVSAADKYTVVSTVGMIGDIVKNVAGERVNNINLMGPGVDPHLYKPTRSDIQRLLTGDVIFYNGLLLEGKMTDSLIRAATGGKKVFAVTDLLDEKFLLEPPEFQGHYDPHVWMDPQAWAKAAEVIRDKLIEHDPSGSVIYNQNAATYLKDLKGLDEYATKVLQSIPENQRVLITAHDAFNYFGRRYNFQVVGIQGISTESEAGVHDIERLVDLIVEKKIPSVFIESTVSEKNINALVAGAGARGQSIKIGGKLFSDAMGADGTYEGTYVGMIDHNVTLIAKALGGTPPEKGYLGKLNIE